MFTDTYGEGTTSGRVREGDHGYARRAYVADKLG